MKIVWTLASLACLWRCEAATIATTTPSWQSQVIKVFGNVSLSDNEITKCTSDDGTEGECVVYYQCDSDTKKLITDGTTLIDIRFKEDSPCPKYLHVCCGRQLINKTAPVVPNNGRKGECGYSNPGASEDGFRVGGLEHAEFAEFPWMLAVLSKPTDVEQFTPKNYLGGASLIHPRLALTGAHKVDGKDPADLKVRAGEWDTLTQEEIYPYQERDVERIIVHEDFYRATVANSVALLVLTRPFELAPHIDVACLAHVLPPPGTPCFSMGWGKEDFGNNDRYANALKKVPLPIVSREKCQNALRGTRVGSYFILHFSFMCAGGEKGVDTCRGDGGSPLVCSIGSGRFAVVGMVAWGIGCGETGVPGVYTDVTRFRDWITQQVRELKLDPASFEYTEP